MGAREFENEEDFLFTFKSSEGYFCIVLNAICIHSVKTEKAHLKKLNELLKERNLIETSNENTH